MPGLGPPDGRDNAMRSVTTWSHIAKAIVNVRRGLDPFDVLSGVGSQGKSRVGRIVRGRFMKNIDLVSTYTELARWGKISTKGQWCLSALLSKKGIALNAAPDPSP